MNITLNPTPIPQLPVTMTAILENGTTQTINTGSTALTSNLARLDLTGIAYKGIVTIDNVEHPTSFRGSKTIYVGSKFASAQTQVSFNQNFTGTVTLKGINGVTPQIQTTNISFPQKIITFNTPLMSLTDIEITSDTDVMLDVTITQLIGSKQELVETFAIKLAPSIMQDWAITYQGFKKKQDSQFAKEAIEAISIVGGNILQKNAFSNFNKTVSPLFGVSQEALSDNSPPEILQTNYQISARTAAQIWLYNHP